MAEDKRTDRLKAAEEDTGFALDDRVIVPGTNHGVLSVVGFARINVPGIEGPMRGVCVADKEHLRMHGFEAVIIFAPPKLRRAPQPAP